MKNLRPERYLRVWLALFLSILSFPAVFAGNPQKDFRLCMQSFVFHGCTLSEALEKTGALGLKYLEVYPGHRLGDKYGGKVFDHYLDEATCRALLEEARTYGVRIVAMGVCSVGNEDEWDKIFAFADRMGMEYVVCEPAREHWRRLEWLTDRYKIKAGVHNRPRPYRYWSPDALLDDILYFGRRIGACADVEYWCEEGLDPAQCLQKLKGRIVSLHLDVEDTGIADAGKGADMKTVLGELGRQGFKGYIALGTARDLEDPVPELRRCIDRYERILPEL